MKRWDPPWSSLPPVAPVPRREPIPPRELSEQEKNAQLRRFERTHLAAVLKAHEDAPGDTK